VTWGKPMPIPTHQLLGLISRPRLCVLLGCSQRDLGDALAEIQRAARLASRVPLQYRSRDVWQLQSCCENGLSGSYSNWILPGTESVATGLQAASHHSILPDDRQDRQLRLVLLLLNCVHRG